MNKKININETYILEEEIFLTTEEIYNYGLEYSKKKKLNLSYNEVVNILYPHIEYLLTECDVEDIIDDYFEDDYEFIPEDEDNSDYRYEYEEEEEIEYILEKEEEEYEEEYEYFM